MKFERTVTTTAAELAYMVVVHLRSGHIVQAVKEIRDTTGLGLRDSKVIADQVRPHVTAGEWLMSPTEMTAATEAALDAIKLGCNLLRPTNRVTTD